MKLPPPPVMPHSKRQPLMVVKIPPKVSKKIFDLSDEVSDAYNKTVDDAFSEMEMTNVDS